MIVNTLLSREDQLHNIKEHYRTMDDDMKYSWADTLFRNKLQEMESEFISEYYLEHFLRYIDDELKEKFIKHHLGEE